MRSPLRVGGDGASVYRRAADRTVRGVDLHAFLFSCWRRDQGSTGQRNAGGHPPAWHDASCACPDRRRRTPGCCPDDRSWGPGRCRPATAATAPTPTTRSWPAPWPAGRRAFSNRYEEMSRRLQPWEAAVAACSGPRATKYSPWLMVMLFCPIDAIADAHLSRMLAGWSLSMSWKLCGASPQCTVTAEGASTPRLRAIALPRGGGQVLGDAVGVLGRSTLGRGVTRSGDGSGHVEQHQAQRSAGRGVGPVAGAEGSDAAVVAGAAHHFAVHDEEGRHAMGRGVDAPEVHLGPPERPDRRDEHGQMLGTAAGEHGVDGDDPPGGLPETWRQRGDDLVGVDRTQDRRAWRGPAPVSVRPEGGRRPNPVRRTPPATPRRSRPRPRAIR